MKFREDIEGLRGVAVLWVILAHAGVTGLEGGFIGVDLFFVISGFLITGLLTEELRKNGTVDYWSFFDRRVRRLAPGLLVMVLAVSLASILFLPAAKVELQLESAAWTALWSSNIYFMSAGFDYFGQSVGDSLFLHAWSLAVEEQFYLVWPWLLAFAWKRWGARVSWLVALSIISLVSCLAMLHLNAVAAYYLMPTRLWQLAAGGLVYRLVEHPSAGFRPDGNVLGVVGATLLLLGLWWIDGTRPYPSFNALLPTVGTGCLLWAGASGGGWITRILSSQVLRLPGRISYSWYLWHWPFLLFVPALGLPRPAAGWMAVLVCASFLMAWACHACIEQPLRKRVGVPRRVVAYGVLSSFAMAVAVHLAITPAESVPVEPIERRVRADISKPAIYAQKGCDQWYKSADLVPCEAARGGEAGNTMLYVGDSVGAQWLPALEQVAARRGMRLVVLTKSACPMVDEPYFYERIRRQYTECEQWRAKAIRFIRDTSPQLVVMGSMAQYPFSLSEWRQGTARILGQVAAPGRPVVVLAPTPVLDFDGPGCVITNGRMLGEEVSAPACGQDLDEVDPTRIIGQLRTAVRAVDGSSLLYLNDVVCPEGECVALAGGHLVYRDSKHLNARYVEALGPAFERRLEKAIADAGGSGFQSSPATRM